MRVEHSIGLVVATAIGVMAAAFQTPLAQAQTDTALPLAAAWSTVDACGMQIVELAPQPVPESLVWTEFGSPFDSAFGVIAYAHGRLGDPRRENAQGLYQCTELVHRYLRQGFGVPTRIGLGLGHGVDLAQGLAERFGQERFSGGITGQTPVTLRYNRGGSTECPPAIGSVVSIAMPLDDGSRGYGHVGVIRAITRENGALMATLFEQHGGDSLEPGDVIGAGQVRFEFLGGAWRGTFLSQSGRDFAVEGWTNIVVADDAPASGPATTTAP